MEATASHADSAESKGIRPQRNHPVSDLWVKSLSRRIRAHRDDPAYSGFRRFGRRETLSPRQSWMLSNSGELTPQILATSRP